MAVLVCQKCGHENEPERVYCHNCGEKLDRSNLKEELEKEKKQEQVQKKVKATSAALRASLLGGFKGLAIVLVASFVVAAIIQIVRVPENTPEPAGDAAFDAPEILFQMENAIHGTRPVILTYSQDQVNGYLSRSIRGEARKLPGIQIEFERVFAIFDEDLCGLYMEHTLWGAPFYAGAGFQITYEDGEMQTQTEAVYLGRLELPAFFMKPLGFMFEELWHALRRENRLVSELSAIEFKEEAVSMTATPR